MKAQFKAKFGLPEQVKFCKTCVVSNQRPNSEIEFKHTIQTVKKTINFDSEGICDACTMAKKKKEIDWKTRDEELRALCDKFRRNDGYYDCIVPGSGGKDSFYAAYKLKYEYGMHPLTITWAPHMYTPWGWRNFMSWIGAGFDNYLHTPNGRVHRLLTRLALDNLLHPFQPFILGQKSVSVKMAILMKIPLIFYGENEAEYGNPLASAKTALQDWSYYTSSDKSKIFIGGVPIKDLLGKYGLQDVDLLAYMPADPKKVEQAKVHVHHMGYYLKWHPQGNYYYSVENGGFEASEERTPGTYSKYNSIDDKIDDFHYYTTYIKFGIGRATYDAAQEIRSGDITREEGVALVHRFDGEYPIRFEKEIFAYLSMDKKGFPKVNKLMKHPIMDREYFFKLADKFRSPHLWNKKGSKWELRYHVS